MLKRETHLIKIKESAETGKALKKNTKETFQLEFDWKTIESRNRSLQLLPRPKRTLPNPRELTGCVEKTLRMDCTVEL